MATYITTPIYYVNALPHLGHAYTTIVADTYCRYKRLCGEDVLFQTGTDEHGEKIAEAAAKTGESPRAYVDRMTAAFKATWPLLDVEQDKTIRTTDPKHIVVVQQILQKVYEQGDIYFSEYSGLYCSGCERFLTAKELVDGKCTDHQKAPTQVSEQNYFFRMSKYQDWLIDHIRNNPEFISPERYRNEVLSFLSEPLEDLCISRPISRLTWGIPLPFDANFVTYVWFDALINYLTGIDYPNGPDFDKYWAGAEHLIAKDILKPHAIYWPTMLAAIGLPPYQRLHVHGYWNVDDTKMSKSIGNVVQPPKLVASYGADTLRYFVLREMSFGLDSSFSTEAIVHRYNADLANDLGNLFSRSLTMIERYAEGRIPKPGHLGFTPEDVDLFAAAQETITQYRENMDAFFFHKALQAVWDLIGQLNRYIVGNAPWELAKDASQSERLKTVLHVLAELLWRITLLLKPVMPESAAKMAKALGMSEQLATTQLQYLQVELLNVETLNILTSGAAISKGEALFPRLEPIVTSATKETAKTEQKASKKAKVEASATTIEANVISFEQFQKVKLRVAEIVAAEAVSKSDRLLKLSVKSPEERTIVAGIAQYYRPEELIGQQVVIVANLQPAKLMGINSQGMVLAAKETLDDGSERLVLIKPEAIVAPGSKVS